MYCSVVLWYACVVPWPYVIYFILPWHDIAYLCWSCLNTNKPDQTCKIAEASLSLDQRMDGNKFGKHETVITPVYAVVMLYITTVYQSFVPLVFLHLHEHQYCWTVCWSNMAPWDDVEYYSHSVSDCTTWFSFSSAPQIQLLMLTLCALRMLVLLLLLLCHLSVTQYRNS